MGFFTTSVTGLKTVVTAIGAGVWGVINLLEGYGNDNLGANAHVRYSNTQEFDRQPLTFPNVFTSFLLTGSHKLSTLYLSNKYTYYDKYAW